MRLRAAKPPRTPWWVPAWVKGMLSGESVRWYAAASVSGGDLLCNGKPIPAQWSQRSHLSSCLTILTLSPGQLFAREGAQGTLSATTWPQAYVCWYRVHMVYVCVCTCVRVRVRACVDVRVKDAGMGS